MDDDTSSRWYGIIAIIFILLNAVVVTGILYLVFDMVWTMIKRW